MVFIWRCFFGRISTRVIKVLVRNSSYSIAVTVHSSQKDIPWEPRLPVISLDVFSLSVYCAIMRYGQRRTDTCSTSNRGRSWRSCCRISTRFMDGTGQKQRFCCVPVNISRSKRYAVNADVTRHIFRTIFLRQFVSRRQTHWHVLSTVRICSWRRFSLMLTRFGDVFSQKQRERCVSCPKKRVARRGYPSYLWVFVSLPAIS